MVCKNFAQHIKTIDASVPKKHPLMNEPYNSPHELIEIYLSNLFASDTSRRKNLILDYKYNPIDYN